MKTVSQVFETNDYSLFKMMKGNRMVNPLFVKRLKESFAKEYLLSPIIVNENFEIVDGQNRYTAAKEMGLPIRFIMVRGYTISQVHLLNSNMKNWNRKDYLHGYCELGYPEYLKFRNFMRRFRVFGIEATEAILMDQRGGIRETVDGEERRSKYFEEGRLVIPHYEHACEVAEKICMLSTAKEFDLYNSPLFVRAMIGVLKHKEYVHSEFVSKCANGPKYLRPCSRVEQYKLLIEEIFNNRRHKKINLRYF